MKHAPLPSHRPILASLLGCLALGAPTLGGTIGCQALDGPTDELPGDEEGAERDELDAAIFVASGDQLGELLGSADEDGWAEGPAIAASADFDRVGIMFDARTPVRMQVRSSDDGGATWAEWVETEVAFSEEGAHNAYADLDGGAEGAYLQVRFRAPAEAELTFLRMNAFVYSPPPAGGVDLMDEADTERGLARDRIDVVSRSAWGARPVSCGGSHTPNRMTIHHTETPNGGSTSIPTRIRQIQNFHIDGRGWCDIGYHLLIGPDGKVYQGRLENRRGAHAGSGNNTNNVGISFVGSFMNILPNSSQLEAGAAAVRAVSDDWNIALTRSKIKGHRQMRPTDCPGDALYGHLEELIDMAGGQAVEPPPPAGCSSSTLGAQVESGACVQVSYQGCGLATCGWFRCNDGDWQCTGQSACGADKYQHASCEVDDPDPDEPPPSANGIIGPIGSFPFNHDGDTSDSPRDEFDSYSCAPGKNEQGPEVVYELDLATSGTLTATLSYENSIDVDVHILSALSSDACLDRHDISASAAVGPGTVYVVVDTYRSSLWGERPGAYSVHIGFESNGGSTTEGDCAMQNTDQEMFWTSCASSMDDCYSSGGRRYISLPTTGPVVKEAHLVTHDDGFGSSWPGWSTQNIEEHYALSQSVSGYVMNRTESWAPAGEGGSEHGQGSTGGKIPVLDEAWYITMYWKSRPDGGTRMIVTNPANGRSIVASAGWETGPGATSSLAGVSEEIHHYLGTTHLDDLTVGFAADQSLPLGPVQCGAGPDPVDPIDPDDPPEQGSYGDVPSNHAAFAAAETMRSRGALWGCSPGSFCPDDALLREQLANLLAANETSPVTLPSSPAFDDIGTSHWAYQHVQELKARSITYGCGNALFCPTQTVSRASFAVYLRRAMGLTGVSGSPAGDVASGHWAAEAIGAVVNAGLMDDCGGGNFCPNEPITRADAAVFTLRAYP